MNPILDPQTLDPLTLGPIICLVSEKGDIPSDVIEIAEDGSCNEPFEVCHAQSLTTPGMFNCMAPDGFKQVPISTYMVKGTTMYFFSFVNTNPAFMKAYCDAVNARLGKQGYDWAQIIGDSINIFGWKPFGWLHCPTTEDCSEEVTREMKASCTYLPAIDNGAIMHLDNQSEPQDLMTFFRENPSIISFIDQYSFPS